MSYRWAVFCLVLGAIAGVSGHIFASWLRWTAPVEPRFYTTSFEAARAMLKLAGVKPGELVVDLGCGDGRIVVVAVKEFRARGVCVERDGYVLMDARANATTAGVSDYITFVHGDALKYDVSGADVVTLYLSPELNEALRPGLQAVKGLRVVSQSHDMGKWRPDEVRVVKTKDGERRLVLWRVD